MRYRKIGKSDLMASEIGYGCMSIDLSAEGNERLLQQAIDQGISYFDTADLYDFGENERLLGKALYSHRQNVIFATKVGNEWKSDKSGWSWNATKSYIIQAAENSLKRLRTDYIDILQLHGGTIEDNFEETIEAFTQLQQEGKIRYYGMSSIRPNVIRRFAEHGSSIANMMQYSLLDRRSEEAALGILQNAKISVMARGVLAKGILAGKPPADYMGIEKVKVADILNALSSYGNPQAVAQRYVLDSPVVSSLIIGMRTSEQLASAINAYKASQQLSIAWSDIKELLPDQRYEAHR